MNKKYCLVKTAMVVFIIQLLSTNLTAQYQPTWESLDQRPVPQRFKDSQHGIFIQRGKGRRVAVIRRSETAREAKSGL